MREITFTEGQIKALLECIADYRMEHPNQVSDDLADAEEALKDNL